MEPNWEAAYNILMNYWDCIPEEERILVDQKLRIALNECNDPLRALSKKRDRPPRDCIKNALKRLKDQCNFGIPDKETVNDN